MSLLSGVFALTAPLPLGFALGFAPSAAAADLGVPGAVKVESGVFDDPAVLVFLMLGRDGPVLDASALPGEGESSDMGEA